MNGVTEFVRALGPGRIAAMGLVAAIMVGFFAFIMLRWSAPQMAPLATDVSLTDSAAIVRELDRLQIRYEVRNEGTTILVARPDVARARMRLAEQGLPKGGGVGYEIFDRGETLGTTSFVQNLNHLRALEGELSRSIRTIGRVQAARVHLVMPERQVFARERQEPTASIVLRLQGTLEQPQVRAIQHLVAAAVPGMRPTSVSVVDESGRLLASGRGEEAAAAASGLEERRLAHEARLRRDVEEILAKIVGPGRARVQVAAELDWNRITQTQDMFDPEARVARSTHSRRERTTSQEPRDRQVTVGNELPGRTPNAAGAGAGDSVQRENTEKTEEITNFEISRTQRQEVTEAGRLRRVSIAVLVDGVYQRQGNDLVYQPRQQEELDRIGSLVRSAIGFDERRGDRVEVVNLRFAEGPPVQTLPAEETPASLFAFTREDLVRFAEMGVMLILGLLMLLFVIRPLLKRALGEQTSQGATAANMVSAIEASNAAAITDASGSAEAQAGEKSRIAMAESATTRALEVAEMTGQMHAQSVQKIGELVQQNPNEAVAIVRSWMNEKPQAA